MRRMKIFPRHLDLIYPLDVYAALMQHHAGRLPALGFGSLDADQVAQASTLSAAEIAAQLIEAQQHQFRKLLAFADIPRLQSLRSKPLQVLEIGCGSGELARQFAATGCNVTALDCSAEVMEAGLQDCGINPVVADFSTFAADADQYNRYDLIILQNSARYFLPMQLLSAVKQLLSANGELVILEEFTANTLDSHKPQPLPVFDHFVELAERLGLMLQQQEDLNPTTLPFQQLWCQLFFKSLPMLEKLTPYSAEQLGSLYQSIYEETVGTGSGRLLHRLLRFSKTDIGDNGLLLVSASSLPAAAFAPVFEASFDVTFDTALWNWKYQDGRGASVAAVRDGKVLAHYGGIMRRIFYFGEATRAVQICDVMVLPGERSFFSRKGLFFKTASTMLEHYAGYHAENLLGFGFPNLKAMHVAERLKLYEQTDELMQIMLVPDCAATGWQHQAVTLESVYAVADRLWSQMQPGFVDAIIGIRDADYLHYRYLQRPGLEYRCVQVNDGETVKGLGFMRRHGDGWLLMDVVAASADMEAVLKTLLQSVSEPICFWLTAGQLPRIQSGAGFSVSTTGILIPCNRWSRGPDAESLRGRWWLTAGDMDFL